MRGRMGGRKGVRGFLLPERAPSEGPRSTAAVESSSHPRWLGDERKRKCVRSVKDGLAEIDPGTFIWLRIVIKLENALHKGAKRLTERIRCSLK